MKLGRKSKWLIAIVGLIGGSVVVFARLGHKVVHTELVIPASPSAVWHVVTDAAKYPEWNPTIVRVEGAYELDAVLMNHVRDGSGEEVVMKSRVVAMLENRELHQFGGTPGLLTFDHKWILEPVADGTRVIQHEEYRGLGVWFWDASWVEPAYQRSLEALSDRVAGLAEESNKAGQLE